MNFLTNPWFVGIIGGIISGIIVFFITGIIVNKINKKDYYKSVEEVNLKISKMLIMSISENKIPSSYVIDSLLSSLAKRYKVQKKDINSVEETYNDLITELFETNFIPIDKKQNLAESLIEIKNTLSEKENISNFVSENIEIDTQDKNYDSEYAFKRLKAKLLSFVISIGIVVPVYFISMYTLFKDNAFFNLIFDSKNISMIISIMTVTFSFVMLLLTTLALNKKNLNKRRNEEPN